MLSNQQINRFSKFAEHIAVNAGKILLDYRDKISIKKHKTDLLDIATSADYASEKYIIEQIKKNYPDHSIYAEEAGSHYQLKSYFEWVIDPLDGTKEYFRNIPYYFVLICLEYKDKVICAIGYQPETDRLYRAQLYKKPSFNGKEISVSNNSNLSSCFLYTLIPNYKFPKDKFNNFCSLLEILVYESHRVRYNPWVTEALFYIGIGAAEGFILPPNWPPGPKWWDMAPGILFVERAGGKVTDFYGQPIKNRDLTKGLIASNGKIHDRLLQLVKNYTK